MSVYIHTVGCFVRPVIGRMSKLINSYKMLFAGTQGAIFETCSGGFVGILPLNFKAG